MELIFLKKKSAKSQFLGKIGIVDKRINAKGLNIKHRRMKSDNETI